MCKHFQLTCVEIRLCCKLQQFCCSCNSTFLPLQAHFQSGKFSTDRKFSDNIIVKSWKFSTSKIYFRRKIFVGQSHFTKFSFCGKVSNIFLVVLEIRAKSILCQFVRDCFQRIGQNEGLCNDSDILVIFLYTYKWISLIVNTFVPKPSSYTRKNAQVVTNLQQTCSNAVPTTCQQDVFALLAPSLLGKNTSVLKLSCYQS
jgi:hypothetical protein